MNDARYADSNTELQGKLKKHLDKWKAIPGSLINILHDIQEEQGYVPRDWVLQLAQELDISVASIHEILTFYHHFRLKPQGKHCIHVCTGTACHVKGAPEVLQGLEKALHISAGETTPDGRFTLDVVRCIGACGLAPAVTINKETLSKANAESVLKHLESFE